MTTGGRGAVPILLAPMEPFNTDDVVKLEFRTSSTHRPNDVFVNRLLYRATSGAAGDNVDVESFMTALGGTGLNFQSRWWDKLPTGYYCSYIGWTKMTPVEDIHEDFGYGIDNSPYVGAGGNANWAGGFVPAMCGVVTKKTYLPGRRGIGHTYFGPLPEAYYNSGFIDPNPDVAFDLQPVLDFLHSELVVEGITFRPIVAGRDLSLVTSKNDIRTTYWAPRIVQHNYRRPGKGS